MLTILSVFGTRPEAIKMAPVVLELKRHPDDIRSLICVTAQHREMLDQMLDLFGIVPDFDLDLMQDRQSLTQLTARVLTALDAVLANVQPDWVLVQGDTTTVMAVSLAAFYHGIKVGHIEAGLRTHDRKSPYPEEINRRLTSVLADLHFAPTEAARQALLREGVPEVAIRVTGNTVIDALLWVRERMRGKPPELANGLKKAISGKKVLLVTAHRRESFDRGLEEICWALREIVSRNQDVCIVYPVHLNPRVRNPVFRILRDQDRIYLTDPLSYAPFVWLMDQSYLILTDSGGIQEEAPSLGKPVLVMREKTERPEGILAGNAILVGTNRRRIVLETNRMLSVSSYYRQMALANNPYGDGCAAKRIVEELLADGHRHSS